MGWLFRLLVGFVRDSAHLQLVEEQKPFFCFMVGLPASKIILSRIKLFNRSLRKPISPKFEMMKFGAKRPKTLVMYIYMYTHINIQAPVLVMSSF